MSIINLRDFVTIKEVEKQTGVEYHTIVARLNRDKTNKYHAMRTKWGWMVHRDCIEELKSHS